MAGSPLFALNSALVLTIRMVSVATPALSLTTAPLVKLMEAADATGAPIAITATASSSACQGRERLENIVRADMEAPVGWGARTPARSLRFAGGTHRDGRHRPSVTGRRRRVSLRR